MDRLRMILSQIDGLGYKSYKELTGSYRDRDLLLHVDHVQADPYAPPSRIRIEIAQAEISIHPSWLETPARHTALEDFLARVLSQAVRNLPSADRGSGRSNPVFFDHPGQEILPRTAIRVSADKTEARLALGLPAHGRRILGRQALRLLSQEIPRMIRSTLLTLDQAALKEQLRLADDQAIIRDYLRREGLVAFIANGSILPRSSGESNLPLRSPQVVPFRSPLEHEAEILLPGGKSIRGMVIPRGITLIVGGGFHGKSTLLKALERGVYNHVRGDGREYVLTDPSAVKIRAEDGRNIVKVNISPFISHLPLEQDTVNFSSTDASGSTSQAASIIEAIEMGSKCLLIDEDTSASNFMVRDARMQQLVARIKEPITPFIDKVQPLYSDHGISTIMVLGGSGDYFDVADHIILMDEYRPLDVTARAKKIARDLPNHRVAEGGQVFGISSPRIILPLPAHPEGWGKNRMEGRGLAKIICGKQEINLSMVEQLVDPSQTRAIACMLQYLFARLVDGKTSLSQLLQHLFAHIEKNGLDIISPYHGKHPGDLALPRPFEVAAALNRLRTLRVK